MFGLLLSPQHLAEINPGAAVGPQHSTARPHRPVSVYQGATAGRKWKQNRALVPQRVPEIAPNQWSHRGKTGANRDFTGGRGQPGRSGPSTSRNTSRDAQLLAPAESLFPVASSSAGEHNCKHCWALIFIVTASPTRCQNTIWFLLHFYRFYFTLLPGPILGGICGKSPCGSSCASKQRVFFCLRVQTDARSCNVIAQFWGCRAGTRPPVVPSQRSAPLCPKCSPGAAPREGGRVPSALLCPATRQAVGVTCL